MNLRQIFCALALAACLLAPAAPALAAPAAVPLMDDTVVFGENVTLFAGQTTTNLVVFGGNATVEEGAAVLENVVVFGGNVTIHGSVGDSVVVAGGNVELGPSAVVGQDVLSFGGETFRAPGSQVLGNQTSDPRIFRVEDSISAERVESFRVQVLRGFQLFGMLGAAILLVLLTPRQLTNTADTIARQGGSSLLFGALTFVLLPVALVITLITCILPPLILLLVIAGSIFGWVALGLELGRRVEQFLKVAWALEVQAVVGTLLLGMLSFFVRALPCVGWLGVFGLGAVGLGAALLSRFGTEVTPPAQPRRALSPARRTVRKPAAAKPAAAKPAAKTTAARRPRKPRPPAEG
ncbi:MAG: hypothetical protein KIS85_07485 [Anaerolineales bacterium]|nr:hypothetical protein [Anaerolineales bacterium]